MPTIETLRFVEDTTRHQIRELIESNEQSGKPVEDLQLQITFFTYLFINDGMNINTITEAIREEYEARKDKFLKDKAFETYKIRFLVLGKKKTVSVKMKDLLAATYTKLLLKRFDYKFEISPLKLFEPMRENPFFT